MMNYQCKNKGEKMTIIIIVASISATYIIAFPFLSWYESAKKCGVVK